jgi:sulfatase modifying factor 1
MPRRSSSLILSLLMAASSGSAVTIDWTPIGNPGNACDRHPDDAGCYGSVGYGYSIGTYEVTNAQYAEFLNAKATAYDVLHLYMEPQMSGSTGGITRSFDGQRYSHSLIPGRENWPVNWVSYYAALRFVNWMYNGQGNGDTETGAYTLLGGTEEPSNWQNIRRTPGTGIFLARESEWYKAAYYDPASQTYFDYPFASNTQPTCTSPTSVGNSANCDAGTWSTNDDATDADVDNVTVVGSFSGSRSPYGTFDQGGNVGEWNENDRSPVIIFRGGGYFYPVHWMMASDRFELSCCLLHSPSVGFRVVSLPEPRADLLRVAGVLSLLGVARWRRARA